MMHFIIRKFTTDTHLRTQKTSNLRYMCIRSLTTDHSVGATCSKMREDLRKHIRVCLRTLYLVRFSNTQSSIAYILCFQVTRVRVVQQGGRFRCKSRRPNEITMPVTVVGTTTPSCDVHLQGSFKHPISPWTWSFDSNDGDSLNLEAYVETYAVYFGWSSFYRF
jgi:hypothetical protein